MVNNLPPNWSWVKLGDVCEITSSKRIFKKEYSDEGIPFYRTKEIVELSKGKAISVELFISEKHYLKIKELFDVPKKGELLLSAIGTIGVPYLINNDKPFYFKDGNLLWLKNLINIEPKYLNYSLIYHIKKRIETSGSAYNALTIVKLKAFEIPLPPLPFQQKIVSNIEELFSELDSGVASLKKAKEQIKTYRQAVLASAFSGRLNRLNLDSADSRINRIEIQDESGKSDNPVNQGSDNYPSELPEGWRWVKLGETAHINPKLPYADISKDTIVTFLPMRHVKELSGEYDLSEERKYSEVKKGFTPFTNGDVIFAKITPCMENGKIAVLNNLKNKIGFGSTEFHVFRTKEELNNQYLFYFLIQESFRGRHNIT